VLYPHGARSANIFATFNRPVTKPTGMNWRPNATVFVRWSTEIAKHLQDKPVGM
jgi:hypothetical protein